MSETQQVVEQAPIEQQAPQVQEQQVQAPATQEMPQEQPQQVQQQEETGWKISSLNSDRDIYRANTEGFNLQESEEPQAQEQVQQQPAEQVQQTQTQEQPMPNGLKEKLMEARQAKLAEQQEIDPFEKLGVKDDPYFQKLYEAYRNDALEDFLVATHTNYDEIADADLIRMQVENQYPTLQPDEKELIFKMKLEKEFNITDLEDSDNRAGQLLMRLEAQKMRDALKQEQAQYQVKPRVNDEFEQYKSQMEAQQLQVQQQLAQFQNYLVSTPQYKNFETNRIVEFGEGENKIKYEVNAKPEDFVNDSVNQDNFFAKFIGQDGALDLNKWQKVWAYANDPTTVERAIFNAGKSRGEKGLYDELHNSKVENMQNTPQRSSGFVIKSIDGRRFG
jgi:hypothetical protein